MKDSVRRRLKGVLCVPSYFFPLNRDLFTGWYYAYILSWYLMTPNEQTPEWSKCRLWRRHLSTFGFAGRAFLRTVGTTDPNSLEFFRRAFYCHNQAWRQIEDKHLGNE